VRDWFLLVVVEFFWTSSRGNRPGRASKVGPARGRRTPRRSPRQRVRASFGIRSLDFEAPARADCLGSTHVNSSFQHRWGGLFFLRFIVSLLARTKILQGCFHRTPCAPDENVRVVMMMGGAFLPRKIFQPATVPNPMPADLERFLWVRRAPTESSPAKFSSPP